jgi:hypothetical protein
MLVSGATVDYGAEQWRGEEVAAASSGSTPAYSTREQGWGMKLHQHAFPLELRIRGNCIAPCRLVSPDREPLLLCVLESHNMPGYQRRRGLTVLAGMRRGATASTERMREARGVGWEERGAP